MKLAIFLYLNVFLLVNPASAETIITKYQLLRDSNKCLRDHKNESCKKLILDLEQFQLIEFEKNSFKCQSSILGLQTELIEAYFFSEKKKFRKGIMTPYVIKNC